MLENIEVLIENAKIKNSSPEEKEIAYRDIITQFVNVLALVELHSDEEELQLIARCKAITGKLAEKFQRNFELVEDDLFVALEEVPYEDLETSQELASRNMLN